MTNSPRIPKAEINGIYGNLAKTFSRRMLGEVPEPAGGCGALDVIAAPASRTRIADDPDRRNP